MADNKTCLYELPAKKCKKCHSMPSSGLQCINCGILMHPGCIKYYNDIVKIDESRIRCCGSKQSVINLENTSDCEEDLNSSIGTVVEVNDIVMNEKIISDLSRENEILLKENTLLKKLIAEMEDKNMLLLFKISVLEKDTINNVCDSKHNVEIKQGENEEIPTIINDNKTPDVEVRPDIGKDQSLLPSKQDINNRNFPPVKSAENENRNMVRTNNSNKDAFRSTKGTISTKIIKGTRDATGGQNALCGIKPRVWLHIGKTQLGTTPAMIEKHLKQMFPGRSFIIDELKQRGEATGVSFRVGGDLDLVDDLYNGENWPSGITVRRFFFRRYTGNKVH